jgi:hypothetical protein
LLTKSQPAEPRGKQTPRVSHFPQPGVARCYEAAEDALTIAEVAGRDMIPWQQLVVREGMATADDDDPDWQWLAFEVAVLVARQNGKNGGMEVVELGWMINEPGISILHTAHEFQTALESMDKLITLIKSHPLLENEIPRGGIRRGNGKESIRLRNGSIIRFRTRTKSGGRGFSVDRLVIDEAMIWSPASQAAFMPLLTTAKRPQIWYLGSAADEETHEHCGKWASLRSRALSGDDPRLLWLEWSAPEPPENPALRQLWREDRENWAYSNPSMDTLVSEEYIADEMSAFRGDIEKWEVERLSIGRWPKSESQAIDPDMWGSRADRVAELVGSRVIGLALAPDRKTWAVAAAQRTVDGRVYGEIGLWQAVTHNEVVRFVSAVIADWDPEAVVMDSRSLSMVLESKLEAIGVEPVRFNTPVMAQACGTLLDDIDSGAFCHSGQPELDLAARGVQKRLLPQGDFVLDCGQGSAPMVAVALAHQGVLRFASKPAVRPAAPSSGMAAGPAKSEELDLLSVAF